MSTDSMTARTVEFPIRGRRLSVFCLLLIVGALALGVALPPAALAADQPRVDVVAIDGTITPIMARYVDRAIRRAERDGASAVVLEMDTPGGLSSAMDDIVRDILESEVPVVVYVTPRGARAASAGVFITYAAHVAAMAPGTNIGSASPIFLGDDGNVSDGDETLTRKVTNDAVSQIVNLANLRGRNAEWAEQAVRDAVNVTADEALRLDVVDLVAPDVATLLNQVNGMTVQLESGPATLTTSGAEIRKIDMGLFEQFLQLLADPTIAYILLSIGMLGLFLELSNPGAVLPGVAGGLSLLLGLFALGTLPVNWAGVLLIAFAFVLFIADLYLPSLGTLTIGGVISFVLGSYLLIGSDAPPGYEIAPVVIWTMTACLVGFFLFLAASVLKARLRRPYTGKQAMLGEVGVVRRAFSPGGMVMVYGELWSAAVDGLASAAPEVGSKVVVTQVNGLTLKVRPATAAEATAAAHAADARAVVPVHSAPGVGQPQTS